MSLYLVFVVIWALIGFSFLVSILFRVVVPTNEVHIVQRKKTAMPYGKDQENGNVYYNWPSWIPVIWITKIALPVSNFTISLNDYQAYDNWKVPFWVDIKAFFRVKDAPTAAQRVESFEVLSSQLEDILKGAIRKILASKDIEDIMLSRGEFGELFTKEVSDQLKNWWVESVKNVELMDIRDWEGSRVISDIMKKKESQIEKESRIEVAENNRLAEIKEIEAKRDANLANEQASQAVWERAAQKEKAIWVATELSKQEITEQAKLTAEKEMAVKKIEQVKQAEIDKDVAIVKATEQKETDTLKAEWQKIYAATIAEGKLIEQQKEAEWILAVWKANAETEKAMQMAPVEAQINLAEKIAELPAYMEYLLWLEWLKAGEKVWVAKAEALKSWDLKVIANGGSVEKGVNNLLDLFGSNGWTQIWAMLEALSNTEVWKQLLDKIVSKPKNDKSVLTIKEKIEEKSEWKEEQKK